MYAIAGIIAPVFAIILLGATARATRILDPGGLRGINDLTFYLGIPALLFRAVIEAGELRLFGPSALYFLACLVIYAIGLILGRVVLGAGLGRAAVVGLNACYGNTVMIGVPIITAAFGADGVAIMLPIIALHSILLLPLTTVLIEAEGTSAARPLHAVLATLPSIVRNPVIMSLVAALAWRLLGIPVPVPLHRLLDMLGAGAPALALFGLGASLPEFAARGSARETGLTTALKLVVQPLLMWAIAAACHLGPLATAVTVITAGQPTGANAFFLARRTGVSTAASAGSVVVSTVLAVFTLGALLAWLG
jgi:predicted permease